MSFADLSSGKSPHYILSVRILSRLQTWKTFKLTLSLPESAQSEADSLRARHVWARHSPGQLSQLGVVPVSALSKLTQQVHLQLATDLAHLGLSSAFSLVLHMVTSLVMLVWCTGRHIVNDASFFTNQVIAGV